MISFYTWLLENNSKLNLDSAGSNVTVTKTSQLYTMCGLLAVYSQFSVTHAAISVRNSARPFFLSFFFFSKGNCFTY